MRTKTAIITEHIKNERWGEALSMPVNFSGLVSTKIKLPERRPPETILIFIDKLAMIWI